MPINQAAFSPFVSVVSVVFRLFPVCYGNNGQADLFIMRADSHSTRQLTDDPEPDWQPQWGP